MSWIMPADDATPEDVEHCECCEQRGLHVYRADCKRCYSRWLVRGVRKFTRARWSEMRRDLPHEELEVYRRFVEEERAADKRAGHHTIEGRA